MGYLLWKLKMPNYFMNFIGSYITTGFLTSKEEERNFLLKGALEAQYDHHWKV